MGLVRRGLGPNQLPPFPQNAALHASSFILPLFGGEGREGCKASLGCSATGEYVVKSLGADRGLIIEDGPLTRDPSR